MFLRRSLPAAWPHALAALLVAAACSAHAQTSSGRSGSSDGDAGSISSEMRDGVLTLRQSGDDSRGSSRSSADGDADLRDRDYRDYRDYRDSRDRDGRDRVVEPPAPPPPPSEFEVYVNRVANGSQPVQRLGANLMLERSRRGDTIDYSPLVPPDYPIAPGDELMVSLWGTVNGDLRLTVDRSGRITIPRIGAIMVSGVRYADAADVITRRVAQSFRNFEVAVSLGRLRAVRVFVTGFVTRPGAYMVSSLSSIANAVVRAGGPSSSGSFRHIELRRGGALVSTLDFYDLLLKGDRSHDRVVQADDVIHVGPVGMQVAAVGSVNRPAIFDLKSDETLADVLRMAGGTAPVANPTKFAIERMDERSGLRVVQVELRDAASMLMRNGDLVRAFNAVTLATPTQRANKQVRVEGEVLRPGDYVLPAESTIDDALRAAGGLTAGAYVYGTDFSRETVRRTQQENYERALRDLETEFARLNATARIASADEAAAQAGRTAASARLIERLRAIKPTGRVVLELQPDSRELPKLMLEDGDRLYVPPLPTSIGVFGSVFNAGNYLRETNRNVGDYLKLAGGPTKGADHGSTFVIRANGAVISNLQTKTWGGGLSTAFESLPALPGDTLFVPEQFEKTTWVQDVKDWTQILYQFALGAAALVTLTK